MPAGVSGTQYFCFVAASMLSMFMGAQVVHVYFKPMQDFDDYLRRELKNLPEEIQEEVIARF